MLRGTTRQFGENGPFRNVVRYIFGGDPRGAPSRIFFAAWVKIEDIIIPIKLSQSHKNEGSRGAQLPKTHTHAEIFLFSKRCRFFMR